jgi:Fic family protein
MTPPYRLTSEILHLVATISEQIGAINAAQLVKPSLELRKKNRIKTIQSSLSIEGNTLSVGQITAILENKRVVGPSKDVQEVKNAIGTYEQLTVFKATNLKDFLKAHRLLMKELLETAGKFRSQSVGIVQGSKIAHLAPPGDRVPALMQSLFDWLKKSDEHTLIKSCVFHYETEFIHPFMDGNGRIGRLWQTVILLEKYPVFEFLPVETLIKAQQQSYYEVLSKCDKAGDSTDFIVFMLQIINLALAELLQTVGASLDARRRISIFNNIAKAGYFSRKDYMLHFKNISSATASRDLKIALDEGILISSGEKNKTKYQFKENK